MTTAKQRADIARKEQERVAAEQAAADSQPKAPSDMPEGTSPETAVVWDAEHILALTKADDAAVYVEVAAEGMQDSLKDLEDKQVWAAYASLAAVRCGLIPVDRGDTPVVEGNKTPMTRNEYAVKFGLSGQNPGQGVTEWVTLGRALALGIEPGSEVWQDLTSRKHAARAGFVKDAIKAEGATPETVAAAIAEEYPNGKRRKQPSQQADPDPSKAIVPLTAEQICETYPGNAYGASAVALRVLALTMRHITDSTEFSDIENRVSEIVAEAVAYRLTPEGRAALEAERIAIAEAEAQAKADAEAEDDAA